MDCTNTVSLPLVISQAGVSRVALSVLLLLMMAVNTAALTLCTASAAAKTPLMRAVMSQTSSNSHFKVAIVKGGKVMSQTSSNSHNKVAIVKGGKLASVDVRLHQRQPLAAAAHSAASVLLEAGQPSLIDTDKADADAENEVLFQDILLALQLFRQQHGHLRISGGYIVPSEAPWPKVLAKCVHLSMAWCRGCCDALQQ
jgi:hypothetical protein